VSKPAAAAQAAASRPDRAPLASSEAGLAASPANDGTAEAVLHRIAEQIRRNRRSGDDGGRIFAAPLARRLAREIGLELGKLAGSGPRGRMSGRCRTRRATRCGSRAVAA
jgi:pyruvate dehydrogenase E2 component (dihydrolipoamide acetyltransferase)